MHVEYLCACACLCVCFLQGPLLPGPFYDVQALILQQEKQITLLWLLQGSFPVLAALAQGGDIHWHLGCSKAALQELVAFSWLHSLLPASEPNTQQLFPGVDGCG